MPKITYLDPEDTGSVTWHGKSFGPNKAVNVDANADKDLIAAAMGNTRFFKVSGLSGDDKEAAEEAAAEAKEMADREAAALRAEEEADEAEAEELLAASEAITKPGETEQKAAQTQTKKPGAR